MPRKKTTVGEKSSTRQEPAKIATTRQSKTTRTTMCAHRNPPETYCSRCDV